MFSILLLRTSLICILLGCSSQNKTVNQSNDTKPDRLHINNRENAENKILFLTLRITLTDSIMDTYKFTLLNAVFAEGTLNKSSFHSEVAIEPFHLYCEITDNSKKRIDLIKVQNPLLKVFEYSPDKETLEKKLFKSTSGEIYLRFQLSNNSKYLTIYKPHPDLRTLKKIYHAEI